MVDVQDLTALGSHLFQQIDDPKLIAHRTFDESEGDIACNSAGPSVASVIGGALQQSGDGQADHDNLNPGVAQVL